MNRYPHLSPEAEKAMEEARGRRKWASMICHQCNHARSQHGRFKCFAEGCKCRGGFHYAPEMPEMPEADVVEDNVFCGGEDSLAETELSSDELDTDYQFYTNM